MAASSVSYEVHVAVRDPKGGPPFEQHAAVDELRDPAFLDQLEPIRVVQSLRHAKSRARFQPIASLGRVVACESRLEALRLIELERAGGLEWIVAQPFKVVEFVNGRVARKHVPDFLYGLDTGSVVVENVRPPERRSRSFVAQEELCVRVARSLGWAYASVGAYEGAAATVLSYLWQYALIEPRPDVLECVESAFREASAWPLRHLVEQCGRWEVAYPSIMSLLWRGTLEVPIEVSLDPWTLVRLGQAVEA